MTKTTANLHGWKGTEKSFILMHKRPSQLSFIALCHDENLLTRQRPVGWVERSETQHFEPYSTSRGHAKPVNHGQGGIFWFR